jgi:hypothetical protein
MDSMVIRLGGVGLGNHYNCHTEPDKKPGNDGRKVMYPHATFWMRYQSALMIASCFYKR